MVLVKLLKAFSNISAFENASDFHVMVLTRKKTLQELKPSARLSASSSWNFHS